jgi:hypothetical protein
LRPQEDSELSFSFPASEKPEVAETQDEKAPDATAAQDRPSSPPSSSPPVEESHIPEIDPPDKMSPQFETGLNDASVERDEAPDVENNPHRGTPLSTTLYAGLLALLLVIYALVALAHRINPEGLEGFLQVVPGLGPSIFRNSHLRRGVALRSVSPSFQIIRGNREVFVVSGMAVNQNLIGVREIKIEGAVYDAEGKEIERQAIVVGNPITLKIIKAITAQDISTLQKLRPPQRFEISSRGSAPFLIVFLKPMREVKSFHYQVLSAEEAASS